MAAVELDGALEEITGAASSSPVLLYTLYSLESFTLATIFGHSPGAAGVRQLHFHRESRRFFCTPP